MSEVNTDPTEQVIRDMAADMRYRADRLEDIAKKMSERSDLSYSSEALMEVMNGLINMRLYLLITRPIRELSK